ncbi:MAG: hypothetical protein JW738_00080 [Actinobacteria bacterium]|nr:hypothetical protein [Actinomycetota bacterium]
MRRFSGVLLAVVLLLNLLGLVGCGIKEQSGNIDRENIKVSSSEEGITFKSGKNETVVLSEELSIEDLGIPVYPGAHMIDDASSSYAEKDAEGKIKWMAACLETEDSVSEVINWYKEKLADEPGFSDSALTDENTEIGILSFQSGDLRTTVTITTGNEYPYKTTVQVTKSSAAETRSE